MTAIRLSSTNPAKAKADALVVGLVDDGGRLRIAEGGQAVEAALGRSLRRSLEALGADSTPGSVTRLVPGGAVRADVVVLVGLGPAATDGIDLDVLRSASGAVARSLAGTSSAAVALPATEPAAARAVAEGLLLGSYGFRTYKTGPVTSATRGTASGAASRADRTAPLGTATLLLTTARDKAVVRAVEQGRVVASAVNLARDWVNTPPNDLTPASFADAAVELARESGLAVEVLDEPALRAAGYGGLLAVGQGSTHPPRLVRVSSRPKRAKARLAYVGKGITFDSGGLSIKPADGMVTMKCDMAGAAAVVTAASAIARLGLPVEVIGYAALAENMPSATAQRPSDVYRAYGGRTVEVLNTDAEGRLVLADALVRAQEDSPDVLVDVATLTGAMVVALGTRVSGVMGNDDDLRDAVHAAAQRAGERTWPLPLPRDLREKLDSSVADIANVAGDRWGGGLVAALFLEEFVADGQRWAHLDIAGPAFNEGAPYGCTPKGGTGEAVRTLVALAEAAATGEL